MKVSALIGATLLLLGAFVVLRQGGEDASAPTVVVADATRMSAGGVRLAERGDAGSVPTEPTVLVDDRISASSSQSNADPRPPVPTDLQLWSELYTGVSGLVHGTLDTPGVLALWDGLLSRLDEAPRTDHEQTGFVTYSLLDDRERGHAELVVRPEGSGLAGMTIQVSLRSAPGQFTGIPEDDSSETRVEFASHFDSERRLHFLNTTTQVMHHHTQHLRDQVGLRGTPLPTGGIFRITPEAATWLPIISNPGPDDPDGTPTWRHTFGESQDRTFEADRVHLGLSRISDRLSSLAP